MRRQLKRHAAADKIDYRPFGERNKQQGAQVGQSAAAAKWRRPERERDGRTLYGRDGRVFSPPPAQTHGAHNLEAHELRADSSDCFGKPREVGAELGEEGKS